MSFHILREDGNSNYVRNGIFPLSVRPSLKSFTMFSTSKVFWYHPPLCLLSWTNLVHTRTHTDRIRFEVSPVWLLRLRPFHLLSNYLLLIFAKTVSLATLFRHNILPSFTNPFSSNQTDTQVLLPTVCHLRSTKTYLLTFLFTYCSHHLLQFPLITTSRTIRTGISHQK